MHVNTGALQYITKHYKRLTEELVTPECHDNKVVLDECIQRVNDSVFTFSPTPPASQMWTCRSANTRAPHAAPARWRTATRPRCTGTSCSTYNRTPTTRCSSWLGMAPTSRVRGPSWIHCGLAGWLYWTGLHWMNRFNLQLAVENNETIIFLWKFFRMIENVWWIPKNKHFERKLCGLSHFSSLSLYMAYL